MQLTGKALALHGVLLSKGVDEHRADYVVERIRFSQTCWTWAGTVRKTNGANDYPVMQLSMKEEGRTRTNRTVRVAKWLHELLYGPSPEGQYLVRACGTTVCVNPGHYEWSPNKLLRRRVCNNGHEHAPGARGKRGSGIRCPVCRDLRNLRQRAKYHGRSVDAQVRAELEP